MLYHLPHFTLSLGLTFAVLSTLLPHDKTVPHAISTWQTHTHNNRFTALCRDYPGEPVPEETLTHPPSYVANNDHINNIW